MEKMKVEPGSLVIPIAEFKVLFEFMPEWNEPCWEGDVTTIDWNTLMSVVEKLSEPVQKGDQLIRSPVDIKIYYKACLLSFEPDEDFEDLEVFKIKTQGKTKIEAVYKAVVEFVKWYGIMIKLNNESKETNK